MQKKLRLVNKDSANMLPPEQLEALESMQNTYTANMPEVYNYSQSIPSNQNTLFPPIVSTSRAVGQARQATIIHSPKNSFLQNADISLIDTV